jgi:hypothetical protein
MKYMPATAPTDKKNRPKTLNCHLATVTRFVNIFRGNLIPFPLFVFTVRNTDNQAGDLCSIIPQNTRRDTPENISLDDENAPGEPERFEPRFQARQAFPSFIDTAAT